MAGISIHFAMFSKAYCAMLVLSQICFRYVLLNHLRLKSMRSICTHLFSIYTNTTNTYLEHYLKKTKIHLYFFLNKFIVIFKMYFCGFSGHFSILKGIFYKIFRLLKYRSGPRNNII